MLDLYQNDWAVLSSEGIESLAGIDEAGRGALAGPVVIAAVILDYTLPIEGLNDSKKLSPKTRDSLYDSITRCAKAWQIVEIHPSRIDEINIRGATLEGFVKASKALNPDLFLIDGIDVPDHLKDVARAVIKGDGYHACIAAASILAKVHRDRLMQKLDGKYPEYGFAHHKGYGTMRHYQALAAFGVCPIHRKTFRLN